MRAPSALPMWLISSVLVGVCVFLTVSCQGQNPGETRGGPTINLPAPVLDGKVSVEQAIQTRRSVRTYSDDPITLSQVSQMLWAAQGITEPDGRLRASPSAGALYPLEIYLVAGQVTDLAAGIYHYTPDGHKLSRVVEGDKRADLAEAALGQSQIASSPASFVIAADISRTERRYRERATRFVHIEVGHAGQNICLQAVSLGLSTVPVGAMEDEQVKRVLNLPASEDVLYIIPVGHGK